MQWPCHPPRLPSSKVGKGARMFLRALRGMARSCSGSVAGLKGVVRECRAASVPCFPLAVHAALPARDHGGSIPAIVHISSIPLLHYLEAASSPPIAVAQTSRSEPHPLPISLNLLPLHDWTRMAPPRESSLGLRRLLTSQHFPSFPKNQARPVMQSRAGRWNFQLAG